MDTDLLTTAEAAAQRHSRSSVAQRRGRRCQPAAIRQLGQPRIPSRAGLTETGRPLYRLVAVARAERVTRGRALRLVGISEKGPFGLGGAAIALRAAEAGSGTTIPDLSVGK
ncbi:MerR family transcriptional regulator [Streptomyces pratensis]|nr:MerR family transcriptional regulator [Streptomyces pratensis]